MLTYPEAHDEHILGAEQDEHFEGQLPEPEGTHDDATREYPLEQSVHLLADPEHLPQGNLQLTQLLDKKSKYWED